MNLKEILVHVDDHPTCGSRLEVAVRLARQQQARLTGIYLLPHLLDLKNRRATSATAEAARARFLDVGAQGGVETEWLQVDTLGSGLDATQMINLHAHYRDLLVVSQTDRQESGHSPFADLPERAVLGSGRPVLIVPYAGKFASIGRRVMLAWRGGPESSRALHDSMTILRQADSVRVITVQGRGGDEAYQAHNADICRHLIAYGVATSCEKLNAGELSVGDLLLNRAADNGIDLLVMGAFAQSRRGQPTLGEVGRYLLECMTIPVLMSH